MYILVKALEKIAYPEHHLGLNISASALSEIAKKALDDYRSTATNIKPATSEFTDEGRKKR